MDFQDAVKTGLRKYIQLSGRATRSEYWWFMLFNVLVGLAARYLIGGTPGMLMDMALFVPTIMVSARRMHDINLSGWWQLVAVVPVFGWLCWLILATRPGQPFRNRYGFDPSRSRNSRAPGV
jgi:uncharacterized membrane protein YhaH (DUF805 family)